MTHRIRGAGALDLRLITHAWVQEMRHGDFARGVPDDIFFPMHRKVVLALARRAWTLVACNPEDDDHLYGFVTFELAPARLHWLYVKSAYQRVGLGTELITKAFGEVLGRETILCSHSSKFARTAPAFIERHRLLYDPYLLLKDTPHAESHDDPERPQTFDGPDSPGP